MYSLQFPMREILGQTKLVKHLAPLLFFFILLAVKGQVCLAETPAYALIIAPHPDDEALMGAGIIYRCVKENEKIRVIVITNGDAEGSVAGLRRQAETVNAMAILGLREEDIIFLGYPDDRLLEIVKTSDEGKVFTSVDGLRSETFGEHGLGRRDWHSFRFGTSGKYTKGNLISDLALVMKTYQPRDIFTTAAEDVHPDHSSTYLLVEEVLQRFHFNDVKLHKTIIHNTPGDGPWPNPADDSGVPERFQPESRFLLPPISRNTSLNQLRLERFELASPLRVKSKRNLKLRVLQAYASQYSSTFNAYCHRDEFFWLANSEGGGESTRPRSSSKTPTN